MKKLNSKMSLIIVVFVALISLMGCNEKKNDVAVTTSIVNTRKHSTYVKVATVVRKNIINYQKFSGLLFSEKSANIAPDLAGKVLKCYVDKGAFVHKNDLLALMDTTQYVQAKIQYKNAGKSYQRMLELKKKGSIDEQTFDQVETGYKAAKESYLYMLKNKEIRAPFAGYITDKLKNEGEVFSPMPGGPTAPAIFRLVNIKTLKLKIQISDRILPKIKKGQKVIISTDSYPESEFIGKISFISQEADMMSGTFTCEITVNNSDNKLKANQFARVKIILAEEKDAIVVPQNAIVRDNTVFIVNNHKAEKRIVTLGIQNEDEVQILSGINERDIVITNGNIAIENGTIVKIVD